ncbi:MAG: hypothetical protein EXR65_03850 [Dehalococcoidia bacterium]|nr:hypothetical protein [Dehalococcoidia bacterium]
MSDSTLDSALAIRTSLTVCGLDGAPYLAARGSAADAVTLDLAAPAVHGRRAEMRRLAAKHAHPIAAAGGAAVHVRVSDTRSSELDADIAALVSGALAAIVLSGAETPQDVRDADVAIRKQEMRLGITPGAVRLIPEIDSAAGLLALPALLAAVDRHGAVALDLDGLRVDLRLAPGTRGALEHAFGQVAVAARAAGLPWLITARASTAADRAQLATQACEFGAAGAAVASEAEVLGLNALFTPPPEAVAAARRSVEAWDRRRERASVLVSNGALVDRRRVRAARALVALADAIERRERGR